MRKDLQDLIDDLRLNHEFCPKEVILRAADELEKYKWDVHSCGPTCKRYACVAMREAVEAEREACAGLCDRFANRMMSAEECADAIRARGATHDT